MCSKSSYLPSLEGMPCKIWLAACSILSIDFEGPFHRRRERVSVAVLTVTCWPQHVPDPSPRRGSFPRVAAWRGRWLRWHVRHIRAYGCLAARRVEQPKPSSPALLLQQMGEAWHSILRQMPPPYSTCLELGHGTEWTVCLIIKETKTAFMKLSRAPYLRSMHRYNCQLQQ